MSFLVQVKNRRKQSTVVSLFVLTVLIAVVLLALQITPLLAEEQIRYDATTTLSQNDGSRSGSHSNLVVLNNRSYGGDDDEEEEDDGNVFTEDSIDALNTVLEEKKNSFQMLYLSIVKGHNQEVVSRVWLVLWPSLLFVKPYTQLYSLFTIDEKFEFLTLELVKDFNITSLDNLVIDVSPPVSKRSKKIKNNENVVSTTLSLSPWVRAVYNLTNVDQLGSGETTFSICSELSKPDGTVYERKYTCLNMATNQTSIVQAPSLLIVEDCTFTALHLSVIIGFMYYVSLKLRDIKNQKLNILMSDKMRSPPFWQFILPAIGTETKSNFRLWHCVWLIIIHMVLYSLMLFSTFAPDYWPRTNEDSYFTFRQDYDGFEKRFFYSCFPIIIINMMTTTYKISTNWKHENLVRMKPATSWNLRLLRAISAMVISSSSVLFITLYIVLCVPEGFTTPKKVIFGTSAALFGILLFKHLLRKSVYANNWAYEIISKYYMRKAQRQQETEDSSLVSAQPNLELISLVTTIPYWVITAVWRTTLMLLAFHAGEVVERLFVSTMSNLLINPDMITTYSYAASIVGVFYKFSSDIEAPYHKLRSLIAQERGVLSIERVEETNEDLRNATLKEVKSDLLIFKTLFYLIPMNWRIFAKVAKMCNLVYTTRRTLVQLLVTLFVLCVFYMAAKTHDNKFFNKLNDNMILGLVAGTIMPLIPRIVSYFGDAETSEENQLFMERLKSSLLALERKEEKRTSETFDWPVPSVYVPFRFVILTGVGTKGDTKSYPLVNIQQKSHYIDIPDTEEETGTDASSYF